MSRVSPAGRDPVLSTLGKRGFAGSGFRLELSLGRRMSIPASGPAKGEERFVLGVRHDQTALCHRNQLPLVPAPCVVLLASLTDTLPVLFGEWISRRLFYAGRFPLFACQFCSEEMVFVRNVQCREHGHLVTIG